MLRDSGSIVRELAVIYQLDWTTRALFDKIKHSTRIQGMRFSHQKPLFGSSQKRNQIPNRMHMKTESNSEPNAKRDQTCLSAIANAPEQLETARKVVQGKVTSGIPSRLFDGFEIVPGQLGE